MAEEEAELGRWNSVGRVGGEGALTHPDCAALCAVVLRPYLEELHPGQRGKFLDYLCPDPEVAARFIDQVKTSHELRQQALDRLAGLLMCEAGLCPEEETEIWWWEVIAEQAARLLVPDGLEGYGLAPRVRNPTRWNFLVLTAGYFALVRALIARMRDYPPKLGGERRVREIARRCHVYVRSPAAANLVRLLTLAALVQPITRPALRRTLALRAFGNLKEQIGVWLPSEPPPEPVSHRYDLVLVDRWFCLQGVGVEMLAQLVAEGGAGLIICDRVGESLADLAAPGGEGNGFAERIISFQLVRAPLRSLNDLGLILLGSERVGEMDPEVSATVWEVRRQGERGGRLVEIRSQKLSRHGLSEGLRELISAPG